MWNRGIYGRIPEGEYGNVKVDEWASGFCNSEDDCDLMGTFHQMCGGLYIPRFPSSESSETNE